MKKQCLARILALSACLGLLLHVTVWHAWLPPSSHLPRALVLLVTANPAQRLPALLETLLSLLVFFAAAFHTRWARTAAASSPAI